MGRNSFNTTKWIQKAICWQYGLEYKKFLKSLDNVESIQRKKLSEIIKYLAPINPKLKACHDYESFKNEFPITSYKSWENDIQEMRKNSNHPVQKICTRFEPTSGSTNAIKWIPYTKGFLGELNQAASSWLYDTFLKNPSALQGRHYWSLSWVPPELRVSHNSNDVELFPFWQRILLSKIMAVPDQIKTSPSQEASWFATLVYLASCSDLSLISVWSPNFLIQVVKDLYQMNPLIVETLSTGKWAHFKNELSQIECPKNLTQAHRMKNWGGVISATEVMELWPQLSLISSWDSATATVWIPELQKIFPKVSLQGKGLWATEGVVTVPFQNKKVLTTRSHFYEFRCLETNNILPSWQLEKDMFVQPIVTSKNTMLRYELPDKMQVLDFIGKTPCLEFISRINSIDLVGEKIDFDAAQNIINEINQCFQMRGLCLIATRNSDSAPYYRLLIENSNPLPLDLIEKMSHYLESQLCRHYHYQLSRDLGQLGHSQVWCVQDASLVLKKFQKSHISGGNKIEPVFIANNLEAIS